MARDRVVARGEAARAQIAADVHALMAALDESSGSRTSLVYRWLDAHHDELVARLGSQRVNWAVFAAHLSKLGLTDGKGSAPTSSVVRNTWIRVRAAHNVNSTPGSAQSTGAQVPALATQDGTEGAQHAGGTGSTASKAPAQERGPAQDLPASSSGAYPPGVRALTASEMAQDPPGDGASDVPDLPNSHSSTAPDRAQRALPPEGEDCSGDVLRWTATFPSPPPTDVRDLMRRNGGEWDKTHRCWSGVSTSNPASVAAATREAGGSFQVSPSAQAII